MQHETWHLGTDAKVPRLHFLPAQALERVSLQAVEVFWEWGTSCRPNTSVIFLGSSYPGVSRLLPFQQL